MKIAFVVHDFNRTWGHSRYVAELAERFSKEHEVHVFAESVKADEAVSGVKFHRVRAWRKNAFSTVLTFILPATFKIGRSFDIVHSQGLCCLRFNVITAHQCNEEWYQSRRRTGQRLSLREHAFGLVISFFERCLYSRLRKAHVIAVSHRIKDDLRRNYQCQAPIDVIHHGVDTAQFSLEAKSNRSSIRKSWGIAADRFIFLFVGDLRKGARQCILAMKEFPEARLVLISRSEQKEFLALVNETALADRVVFAGPSEKVEQAYAASDAFLMPTPYDPFGLVVTEAMSSGLPVIVSPAAGASELVEHEVNGLLIQDVTNVDELIGHMKRLATDPDLASRLGREARATADQRSWNKVAEETMELYRRCHATSAKDLVPRAGLPGLNLN